MVKGDFYATNTYHGKCPFRFSWKIRRRGIARNRVLPTALAIGELKATAIENVVLVKESVLADKPEA